MSMHNRTRTSHGRAAAAAAATAIVATTTLVGAPAQATPPRAGAVVVGDVLTISGTNAADQITVDFSALDSVVVDLGERFGTRRFAAGSFSSAQVDLRAGDDDFRTITGGSLADVPMTVATGNGNDVATTGAGSDVLDGGNGEDLLLGGAGTDVVVGGNGADFVNGGVGTDVEVLGNGDDTAAWNPGEGNDAIDGGLGRDTLAFNGSNGDELMSLSANGESAVFLRNLGEHPDGPRRRGAAGPRDLRRRGHRDDRRPQRHRRHGGGGRPCCHHWSGRRQGRHRAGERLQPVRPSRGDRQRRHGRGLRTGCPDECHRRRHDRRTRASTPSAATTGSRSATKRVPCSTSRPTSGPTSDQSPGLVTGLRPSSTSEIPTPTPTRRSP